MNVSECPALTDIDPTSPKTVSLFNSLSWNRTEGVSVVGTFDIDGVVTQHSFDPFSLKPTTVFLASVAPFGLQSYLLKPKSTLRRRARYEEADGDSDSISNAFYNLTFDEVNGVTLLNGKLFRMDYLWYNESAGNNANSTQVFFFFFFFFSSFPS
jgi:hypothetical protein